MATVEKLIEFNRGINFELRRRVFFQRTIAGEIGRCKTAASNFLKHPQGYGKTTSSGRPKNILSALSRSILQVIRQDTNRLTNQIKAFTDGECSSRTLRWHLREKSFKNRKRLQVLHHKTVQF